MRRILWLVILGCLVLPVRAEAVSADAQRLFRTGAFLEAAEVARSEQSASGLAFAARAVLAHTLMIALPDERAALIDQAEADARGAIARDPDVLEGHLQLALTLGLRGRHEGAMWAHFEGLASEARDHVDFVLAADPDNAWAHAILGSWHLEIVRNAGEGLADVLYDADEVVGARAVLRAAAEAPSNMSLLYQCALQLIDFNRAKYEAPAVEMLETVVSRSPVSVLDYLSQRNAVLLLAGLKGDDAAFEKAVQILQGRKAREEKPARRGKPGGR